MKLLFLPAILACAAALPDQPVESAVSYVSSLADRCGITTLSFVRDHSVATVSSGGAVFDCVPFAHQPGVPDDWSGFPTTRPSFVGEDEEVVLPSMTSTTACPDGTVAVVRFTRCPPRKLPLPSWEASVGVNHTGFSYVIPGTIHVPNAKESSVILSSGVDVPRATCNPNGACHSLNQLWWSTTPGSGNICTLEAGHIASNYFTSDVTTSMFAFSTNDAYKSDSTDRYNLAGGFSMYPSTPFSLGAPMDTVQWHLAYVMDETEKVYNLWARNFTEPAPDKFTAGVWQAVGFYRFSRFSSFCAAFEYNQAGCEVYQTTKDATASGRILGWGTDAGTESVLNRFRPDPADTGFTASYRSATWSPANDYASANQVVFSGSPISA